jgi:hypothetical protein
VFVIVVHAWHVRHVLVLAFGLGLGSEHGNADQENGRKEYEGTKTKKHERSNINEREARRAYCGFARMNADESKSLKHSGTESRGGTGTLALRGDSR